MKKENKDIKPALLGILVYFGVIVIISIVSFVIPLLFSRFLMAISGMFIFILAFILGNDDNKKVVIALCTFILVLGIISNTSNIMINYDKSNMKQIDYIRENIKDDDIIIYSNIGNGGVIAAFFPDNKQYFYNGAFWQIEEAYKAYGPGMEIIYNYNDVLENYHGRIWLIDSEVMSLWEEFPKEGIKVINEARRFDTKYQDYIYNILLVEKE